MTPKTESGRALAKEWRGGQPYIVDAILAIEDEAASKAVAEARKLRETLMSIYTDARRLDGVCRWCDAPPADDDYDHDVACPAAKAAYVLDLPGYHDWTKVAALIASERGT